MSDVERDAWQTLIESEGWRLVCAYANKQWGTGPVLDTIKAGFAGPVKDRVKFVDTAIAVMAKREAVDELLNLPLRELQRLDAAQQGPRQRTPGRRA